MGKASYELMTMINTKTMTNLALDVFIGANRDELLRRCRARVAIRSVPPPTEARKDRGVPLFLDQLIEELRHVPSDTRGIAQGAAQHGHELLLQGFTVAQVVHEYSDVCQSITDLAVAMGAPISTEDFRTLNRCLDDAIAAAVTKHAGDPERTRDGESHELRNLSNVAMIAFEMISSGDVGVAGSTGALLHRCLRAISALADRHCAEIVPH
jgi:hypothetical protein